ncbi:MAG: hypothetical protein N2235_11950 [Fischerella sp.]|nr:hypothetical protein [Fischerella sp.]
MQREQNLALLPEDEGPIFTPTLGATADLAKVLLIHYSFDLGGYSASELVNRWQKQYPDSWLHLAVVEALYQGRYKAVSVQHILTLWQRRGQASFHFNMEFERLICSKFPESLTSVPNPPQLPVINKSTPVGQSKNEDAETRKQTDAENSRWGDGGNLSPHLPTSGSPHQHNSPASTAPVPLPHKQRMLLSPTANHSPIEQFTPKTSDRSESFTSKLKAMSNDKLLNSYAPEEI